MYFVTQFYSADAWRQWAAGKFPDSSNRHDTNEYTAGAGASFASRDDWRTRVTLAPIRTFAELAECASFLQVMNKRHVLYFRGTRSDYWKCTSFPGLDLPSMLRPLSVSKALDTHLLRSRWENLKVQAEDWKNLLQKDHPRRRTLEYYPETIWAIQQHYKDLLPPRLHEGADARAQSMFLDVTQSLRVAATFALDGREHAKEHAYVSVVALPQTTSSITYEADEQLQLIRLSSVCPPKALRPQLQEAYLVGRFPHPTLEQLEKEISKIERLEERYSLRRRTIAIIPIEVNDSFWGEHGMLSPSALLHCPWFESLHPKPEWNGDRLRF